MTIRIEIENSTTNVRAGKSSRTGRDYEIREQQALMFREGERYPDKVKINIPDGRAAYAPGVYTLHSSSYRTSRFGNIELVPVLTPLPASSKPASAV